MVFLWFSYGFPILPEGLLYGWWWASGADDQEHPLPHLRPGRPRDCPSYLEGLLRHRGATGRKKGVDHVDLWSLMVDIVDIVCMCMCICIYIYTYVYNIYIYVYMCIYIYTHTRMCTCTYAHDISEQCNWKSAYGIGGIVEGLFSWWLIRVHQQPGNGESTISNSRWFFQL